MGRAEPLPRRRDPARRRVREPLTMSTTYLEAIREGLWEEMERDPNVFCIGEDIGEYGGAFKVTAGLMERFGARRVVACGSGGVGGTKTFGTGGSEDFNSGGGGFVGFGTVTAGAGAGGTTGGTIT